MTKSIDSTVTLSSGIAMPSLGLGVFRAASGTRDAVGHALDLGYRHIDTAAIYRNEEDVGRAIRDSPVPREDIFVTTKLWNSDHGYDRAIAACRASLERLGLDYVDLYLIHWPVEGLRNESWRALVALKDEGACRAIGVSNYTIRHLEELLARDPAHAPEVNQVEMSPFLYQKELLDFCREHKIQLEAYSPLARGQKFGHKRLRELAGKYGKTEAQVMIRWALEHDMVVIPKSSRRSRIAENADVFDFALSPDDMARLDALDEGFRVAWDPTSAP